VAAHLDAGPTGPPGKCQAAQSDPDYDHVEYACFKLAQSATKNDY